MKRKDLLIRKTLQSATGWHYIHLDEFSVFSTACFLSSLHEFSVFSTAGFLLSLHELPKVGFSTTTMMMMLGDRGPRITLWGYLCQQFGS